MNGPKEQSFEYTGKTILVVGAGKSGIAALSARYSQNGEQ